MVGVGRGSGRSIVLGVVEIVVVVLGVVEVVVVVGRGSGRSRER